MPQIKSIKYFDFFLIKVDLTINSIEGISKDPEKQLFILMSENMEMDRDRKKSIADLATDRKAEREISQIQAQLTQLELGKIDKILKNKYEIPMELWVELWNIAKEFKKESEISELMKKDFQTYILLI